MFRSDIGKPCQACGHPITREDPAVFLKDRDIRVHRRHVTDPSSGLYGEPTKRLR